MACSEQMNLKTWLSSTLSISLYHTHTKRALKMLACFKTKHCLCCI